MEENKKKAILLVEDEFPLLKAARIKLQKSGFQVVTSREVNHAISMLEEVETVDVIWLDHYLLGKEDGLDFIARIKKDDRWKNIPIVVVSNTASQKKIKAYLDAGVDKYYTKSDFELSKIIDDIKKIIDKK